TGKLEIGRGARLHVDPLGTISLSAKKQITVRGSVEAPGGGITLKLPDAADNEFDVTQSIWLGTESRLSAAGVGRVIADARGNRSGDVLNGGTVTIAAGRGLIVAEPGAT